MGFAPIASLIGLAYLESQTQNETFRTSLIDVGPTRNVIKTAFGGYFKCPPTLRTIFKI